MAERLTLPKRPLSLALLGLEAMLVAGIVGAVFGWRPSAVLLVASVVVFVAFHLVAGVSIFRRTMARPWPPVPPVEDDDWWGD